MLSAHPSGILSTFKQVKAVAVMIGKVLQRKKNLIADEYEFNTMATP